MRYSIRIAAIACVIWAGAAQADSLCGVSDEAALFAILEGEWTLSGATSVETETLSVTEGIDGAAVFDGQGRFSSVSVVEGSDIPDVRIAQDSRTLSFSVTPYNVDGVDDILDTVEADWIADAVSGTPCGPSDLAQLSARSEVPGEIDSTVTFIPYFEGQIVMIAETEMTGDWGLAFVTSAALLEPKQAD